MTDNVTLPGTGSSVATDDIGGVQYQRVKATWGPDGTANDTDTATGKAFPVQVRSATGLIPIGEPTDAASTATDATSTSLVSILKQISKSIQLFVYGAGTASAAQRVTLASDDPAVSGIGSLTETAPTTDTASSGLNGRLQRISQRLTSLIGLLPAALGAGGGLKVDGSGTALPVSAASLPLPSGAATESTLSGVLTTSDFDTKTGSLTETAPASDTASSGINGRLQRVAQRLTSLIALFPTSIGGKTAAASLAVTLASDDPAVATLGAKTDAKSTATDTTSVSIVSVLKQISASCQAFVFGAGTAAAAERVTLASDDPAVATLGATSGAAVITDANGTVQQYLRGLVKQWIAGTLVVGAGTNLIGKVKTKFFAITGSTLTRVANTTAYVAGYSISNNTAAGSVTANTVTISDLNNEPVTIERVRITTTDTGIGTHSVRMWLFNSDPTANSGVQAGDGAAYSQKKAGLIGTLSGTFRAMQDGAFAVLVPDEGSRITTVPGSGAQTLWWQLQALDAFTPISASTFIPTFEGIQGGS